MPELAGAVVHHLEHRLHLDLGDQELGPLVRQSPAAGKVYLKIASVVIWVSFLAKCKAITEASCGSVRW